MASDSTVPFKGSMDTYAACAAKAESPSAERNKQPILEALQLYIPADATGLAVLEVASGSGQHVEWFARHLPGVTFQPSDVTDELFGSICAYAEGVANVILPPVLLDTRQRAWPVEAILQGKAGLDSIVCINMTHISPWAATLGLLDGAARYLAPGGRLFLYGPFKRDGQHTSESNAAFDVTLQARNPEWGYRDTADVSTEAGARGLVLQATHEMPANNFMLVFGKGA